MDKEKDWTASVKEDARKIFHDHESKGPQGSTDDIAKLAMCVMSLCDEVAELKKKLAKQE